MIKVIFVSFIKDILSLISAGFFDTLERKKNESLNDFLGDTYPHSLKEYLQKSTLQELSGDLQLLLPFLRNEAVFNTSLEISKIFRKFLITDFAVLVDGSLEFQNTLRPKTNLEKTLKVVLKNFLEEEIYIRISRFNLFFNDGSTIKVQTPFALDSESKQHMRRELNKEFSTYFVKFSVEPRLVGGMRVFRGGQMMDLSWRSKIKQFTFSRSI